jgi:SET domain-containing protein
MLLVRKSQIPKSGKGLFTTKDIEKGAIVCEYEGEVISWKECLNRNQNQKGKGGYYFYITAKNCVDAQYTLWALGRYANDASGPGRVIGLRNNCQYVVVKGKPYIKATRKIKAGAEILVSYGKEYWDALLSD